MAKNNNLKEFLAGIANKIRSENGTTGLINPQNFETEITGIGDKLRKLVSGTLTEIKASDLQGIKDIKPYAFYYDSFITSVSIPNSVTSIGEKAFSNCRGLTSVTMGSGITSIGNSAFINCTGLTAVTIPNSVTSIVDYAFSGCTGLTSVTIPDSVTSIGKYAFNGCKNLTSVVYKGNVLISSYIFNGCTKIAKYDFRNATSIPTLGNKAYLGHATGCNIIVPDSLYDSWTTATNWSALTDVVWIKASEYTEE